MSDVGQRRLLYLLVFATGACTMGAEIAGARLLAPYFGDSTIVWANTIGVVLVALSVGYWLGGRLADSHPRLVALARLVLLGAVLIALVPFVARPFLGASVDAFDRISIGGFAGSLVGVLVLLAVPVMVLGAVSPWAIRLGTERVESSGRVAGRIYAVSTVGSLAGTMTSALVTIPLLGTQRTFLVFALLVALVATVAAGWRWLPIPVLLAAGLLMPVGMIKAAGPGTVIYEAETPHQYVRVVEFDDGARHLELNEGQAVHSIYRPGRYLVGNYWDESLVLPFAVRRQPPRRLAILGNAAGTVARSYGHFFPETRVDAVEIDGTLTDLGRRFFDLRGPRLHLHTADARPWLRQADGRYDVILVDAYHQPYIPFYLATREFFELVADHLTARGVVLINVGHPEGSEALEKTLSATLATALPELARAPVTDTNVMLAGSRRPISPRRLQRAASGLPGPLRPVARRSAARLAPPLAGGSIWTDDRAPVEWLVDLSLLEYAGG